MEVSQLIELMNAVSEAGLTDFCYEENGVSEKIKKQAGGKQHQISCAPVAFRYEKVCGQRDHKKEKQKKHAAENHRPPVR